MNNEEIQEKFEQLASAIDWIKTKLVDLQEINGLAPVKTPYEVEVPEDIGDYYFDEIGEIRPIGEILNYYDFEQAYLRGLVFKTKEEAEKYDKERILLFKLHKWAEEHNEGWTPDWEDGDEIKYFIIYDNRYETLKVDYYSRIKPFSKLPYFKSQEIAEQFIEEFGDEIKEVLL